MKTSRIRYASYGLRWLILVLSLIGAAGVSGCHPCLVVECGGPWVDAKVFVSDGGELYIDIPEAKKHEHPVLDDMRIEKLDDSGRFAGSFWSFYKSGYSSNTDATALPLRYGEDIKGTITQVSALKLENGTYSIRGFIKFFNNDELAKNLGTSAIKANVRGCFKYENGTARNLHC